MKARVIDRLKEEWANLDPADPLRRLLSDTLQVLKEQAQDGQNSQSIVQTFTGLPRRKLDQLLASDWRVSGVSLERTEEDGSIRRGAVTTGGMVLWWNKEQLAPQNQGQSCYCPEFERLSIELAALKAQQQQPLTRLDVACDIKTLCANGDLPDRFEEVADWIADGSMQAQQCWKCGDIDAAFQEKCTVPACGMKEEPVLSRIASVCKDDTRRLDAIAQNSWDLISFEMPTGAGDADIGWRVIEHHMAKPHERTVGEVFCDDPRQAIDAAIAASMGSPQETGRKVQ